MPEYNKQKRKSPPSARSAPPNRQPMRDSAQSPKAEQSSATRPRRRRRKNMAIYYIMFLLISVIVFSVLSVTVLFNLEEIIVEGADDESIYTSEEIIDAAGIVPGVNLLRLDTERFRQRLISNLVYIDSVTIRKNLPSTLTIQVSGAVEMANIEHEGEHFIVSKNGRILGKADIITGNTVFYGYEADEPVVGGYIRSVNERKNDMIYDIINTMEEVGLKGIVSIDITDHLDIRMNYMNRVEILIGPETELETKLKSAVEMVTNEIDINESGTLRLVDVPMISFRRDMPEPLHGLIDEVPEIPQDDEPEE